MRKEHRPRCKMCGNPLQKRTYLWDESAKEPRPEVGREHNGMMIAKITKNEKRKSGEAVYYWCGEYGAYGNGFFCTLRCGFLYAVRFLAVDLQEALKSALKGELGHEGE